MLLEIEPKSSQPLTALPSKTDNACYCNGELRMAQFVRTFPQLESSQTSKLIRKPALVTWHAAMSYCSYQSLDVCDAEEH